MTYKLEKGVPMPVLRGFEARPIAYPFAQMQMGDSFVIPVKPGESADTVRLRVTKVAQRFRDTIQHDFAVIARVRPEGVRVWRTKFVPRPTRRKEVRLPAAEPYIHLIADDDEQPRKRANGKARQ